MQKACKFSFTGFSVLFYRNYSAYTKLTKVLKKIDTTRAKRIGEAITPIYTKKQLFEFASSIRLSGSGHKLLKLLKFVKLNFDSTMNCVGFKN
jgi:hypothetical protein